MPIEIDPATGAPIITNPSTPVVGKGFEVGGNKPNDAIKPATEAKPLIGMDNRIEEAKKFNSKLAVSTLGLDKKVVEEVKQKINKDTVLRGILKRYGMDSQQQEKAFAEIKSLLGE